MGKHSGSDRSRSRSKSEISSYRNSDVTKGLKRSHSSSRNYEETRALNQVEPSSSSKRCKEKHKKHKKHSKRAHKSKRHETSSDSSTSDSSTSSSSSEEREKRRKEKKRRKKEKKLMKKLKRQKKELAQLSESVLTGPCITLKSDIDAPVSDRAKAMAPMTKEEWDKRQSVIRRVYDEETGRHRLIKGDGEIIEEIVSRDRHMAINRQATKGDGEHFQAVATKKRK